jgi:ATP-dependent helicase/nuclease subunit B
MLLVPDQYSHETEYAMCEVLGNGASCRCEVLSFTRMARRLTDLCGGGAELVLDAGGKMLLLYAALREVAPTLKFYRTPSRKPAFLNSLMATIDECGNYGVAPATLIDQGELQGGSQGEKWQDIGQIYAAYLALCSQHGADPHYTMDRLLTQLKASKWAERKAVYLHAFTDFTPQQEAIVVELARQGDVTLALVCDPEDHSTGVFDLTQTTALRLKRMLGQEGISVTEETLRGYGKYRDESLAFLEEKLFGALPKPWVGSCGVKRVVCADPRREVEYTAA